MSVFNKDEGRRCYRCKVVKPYSQFWKEAPYHENKWWEPTVSIPQTKRDAYKPAPKASSSGFTGRAYGKKGYLTKGCNDCRQKEAARKRREKNTNPPAKRVVPSRKMTPAEYEAAFGKPMPKELQGS